MADDWTVVTSDNQPYRVDDYYEVSTATKAKIEKINALLGATCCPTGSLSLIRRQGKQIIPVHGFVGTFWSRDAQWVCVSNDDASRECFTALSHREYDEFMIRLRRARQEAMKIAKKSEKTGRAYSAKPGDKGKDPVGIYPLHFRDRVTHRILGSVEYDLNAKTYFIIGWMGRHNIGFVTDGGDITEGTPIIKHMREAWKLKRVKYVKNEKGEEVTVEDKSRNDDPGDVDDGPFDNW